MFAVLSCTAFPLYDSRAPDHVGNRSVSALVLLENAALAPWPGAAGGVFSKTSALNDDGDATWPWQVIVLITAKAGCRDAILAAFNDNVPHVLAEDGCEAYGAYVDAAGYRPPLASFGPDTLVVLERWTTREALKAHATAGHVPRIPSQGKGLD